MALSASRGNAGNGMIYILFYLFFLVFNRSWHSSVSIVLGYRQDDQGSIPADAKHFSSFSLACFQTGSGAHPAFCPMGTGVPFPRGVKCGWGEMLTTHTHLVPRSIMSRSCTSCPPWCLYFSGETALLFTGVQYTEFLKSKSTFMHTCKPQYSCWAVSEYLTLRLFERKTFTFKFICLIWRSYYLRQSSCK
jgi:hypothetical protein